MSKHKYNAQKVTVDIGGEQVKFDSKAESFRYQELVLLQRAGEISELELQPEFVLQESFRHNAKAHRAIKYRADFGYREDGARVVEDVKGKTTGEYQIKKKLFLRRYGDELVFREVRRKGARSCATDF